MFGKCLAHNYRASYWCKEHIYFFAHPEVLELLPPSNWGSVLLKHSAFCWIKHFFWLVFLIFVSDTVFSTHRVTCPLGSPAIISWCINFTLMTARLAKLDQVRLEAIISYPEPLQRFDGQSSQLMHSKCITERPIFCLNSFSRSLDWDAYLISWE